MPTAPDWREVLRAERDRGFRTHVEDLTARGLRAIGATGAAAVSLYLLLQVFRGRNFSWDYSVPGAVVLRDKLLILLLTALLIPFAGTSLARRRGRWVAIGVALAASLASVLDDVSAGDPSFASAWVALFLVAAAFALPLNPVQMTVLSISTMAAFLVPVIAAGALGSWFVFPQATFLLLIVLCVQAMSWMLYRTRLGQYRATETARVLSVELADKADRLASLERMKSRFFTGITHDIRTPLSLVLGPVNDVLGQHGASIDDDVRKPLAIAQRNAMRLQELTGDLLDLAQIEAGGLFLDLRPYAVTELVDRCVVDLQPLAERAGITLRFDAPATDAVANVDPDRLAQVIHNLVGNAVAHTPRGGSVTVGVETDGLSGLGIRIRDTGPGIPSEHIPHLFDRFYRAKGPGDGPGYGLGLAIAKEITELHDGCIEVDSEPGTGSTFTVRLPLTGELPAPLPSLPAVPSIPDREARPAGTSTGPADADALPHVLVVDDNADMRDYLRLHLEERYRLSEAARGDDALEIVRSSRPDLVIADVMMPGLDGFALCRAVRENPDTRTLPVVLITARGDAQARIAGLEAGADDFLLKPFDSEALVARLENLIELRRMLGRSTAVGPSEIEVESADEQFVQQVRDVVEEHLADTNFGVDWLADEVALSARQLQRRMRDATRLTAGGFIRMMRLGRAAQLLAAGAANVSETAYAVGFRDADHFARIFRQTHGMPPSEYARKHANERIGGDPGDNSPSDAPGADL